MSAAQSVKSVIIGDGNCGKTCSLISLTVRLDARMHLMQDHQAGMFPSEYIPTVFDNFTYQMIVDGMPIALELWDTAGGEDYDRLRPFSYPNTNIVLVCFQVMSVASFANVARKWAPELAQYCPEVPWILVGLKTDLRTSPDMLERLKQRREAPITAAQGQELAKKLGAAAYCENSALLCENVLETYQVAVRVALCGKRPKIPTMAPVPLAPIYVISDSTFRQEIAAAFNSAATLPDLVFLSHNRGRAVLAHTPVVLAFSPSMQRKALTSLFASVAKGADGVTTYTAKEEWNDVVLTFVEDLYKHTGAQNRDSVKRIAKAMSLGEDDVLTSNMRSLGGLLTRPDDSADIELMCEMNDQPLIAHRCILAMRCPRFRALFASGMADAKQKSVRVLHTTMRLLLEYLYTDELPSNIPDPRLVLAAANEYGLDRLVALCGRILLDQLTEDNIVDTLETAATHNCVALVDECMHRMRMQWRQVYSKRADMKERLSAAQLTEIQSHQYPPQSHFDNLDRYKAELAEYEKRLAKSASTSGEEKCAVQ